jgi:hypothetical protein
MPKKNNGDYDVNSWDSGDMAQNQAEMDAAADPMVDSIVETGITFRSERAAWKYIQKNGLNRVAKAMGGTVGAQTIKGKVQIVVSAPKSKRKS